MEKMKCIIVILVFVIVFNLCSAVFAATTPTLVNKLNTILKKIKTSQKVGFLLCKI